MTGRGLLVGEGDAVGRHRHQRRRTAGQEHEQRFVRQERRYDVERAPPSAFALRCRHRMAAHDHLKGNRLGALCA
jgi:hypothetical protein